jgi:hypothetical protein
LIAEPARGWHWDVLESSDESVIFGVSSDPEPKNTIGHANAKSSVMKTNASRPKSVNLFEM